MAPGAAGLSIVEMQQQRDQLVVLTMHVADDVKGIRHRSLPRRTVKTTIKFFLSLQSLDTFFA